MATNVKKLLITAPTSAGQQTYSLPADFDAKAVILVATNDTSAGSFNANAVFSMGWGTYDGGTVQQQYTAAVMNDNAATQEAQCSFNTTAILRGFTNATPTVAYRAELVSISSEEFVLDWVTPPATAILVHALVFGGSDFTGARAGTFAAPAGAGTSDVPVWAPDGGSADLVLFSSISTVALGDAAAAEVQLGAMISDYEKAAALLSVGAGFAAMFVQTWRSMVALLDTSPLSGLGRRMEPAPLPEWPPGGFRCVFGGGTSIQIGYLALRGTFTKSIGYGMAPLSEPGASYSLSLGTAKGALLWGTETPRLVNAQNADLLNTGSGGFWVGMTDGTDEGMAAIVEENDAPASHCGRVFSTTKTAAHHDADLAGGAPVLASEADGTLSESFLNLDWTTLDPIEREFNYLLIGEPPANLNELLTQSQNEAYAVGGRGAGAE